VCVRLLKYTAGINNAAGLEHEHEGLSMDHFGDELPVLTLWRILEQLRDRLPDVESPQLLEEVKRQFGKQFPDTPFPWNDSFVLEAWQQFNDANA
jgi:hypothetical protein